MVRRLLLALFLSTAIWISAQDQVLRGQVSMELEPIYGAHIDPNYPLDVEMAAKWALEETAMLYSAMIYGWTFSYEVGERARRIDEHIELEPISAIKYGDPSLRVMDVSFKDMRINLWTEYDLSSSQQRRFTVWRSEMIRNAQGIGQGPPGNIAEYPGWLELKKAALDDAARVALRTILRSSERNRPKEVHGFISLSSFPRYYFAGGRWAVSARFRVQITEIIPFAAY